MAAKEGTTVEQEGVSHHYDSAKAPIRQATKEPPITHEHLRHIYGKRGEKANHKMESLVVEEGPSRNQQIEEWPSP